MSEAFKKRLSLDELSPGLSRSPVTPFRQQNSTLQIDGQDNLESGQKTPELKFFNKIIRNSESSVRK